MVVDIGKAYLEESGKTNYPPSMLMMFYHRIIGNALNGSHKRVPYDMKGISPFTALDRLKKLRDERRKAKDALFLDIIYRQSQKEGEEVTGTDIARGVSSSTAETDVVLSPSHMLRKALEEEYITRIPHKIPSDVRPFIDTSGRRKVSKDGTYVYVSERTPLNKRFGVSLRTYDLRTGNRLGDSEILLGDSYTLTPEGLGMLKESQHLIMKHFDGYEPAAFPKGYVLAKVSDGKVQMEVVSEGETDQTREILSGVRATIDELLHTDQEEIATIRKIEEVISTNVQAQTRQVLGNKIYFLSSKRRIKRESISEHL